MAMDRIVIAQDGADYPVQILEPSLGGGEESLGMAGYLPAPPTILCVDDEVNILQALKRLLRREGYQIITATSGEEGLQLLLSHPGVQVIISDQRMPGMSGSDFLMQVKQKYPDIIRVILSGYAEASSIVEAINEGEVYHFLGKPWNDEELKATLCQCLEHYQLKLQNSRLMGTIQEQNDALQYLNTKLKETIDFQAQSLKLTQEVFEQLPFPVLCISAGGIITLTNAAARESKWLNGLLWEGTFHTIFPESMMLAIEFALNESSDPYAPQLHQRWEVGEREIPIHITPFRRSGACRGCIITLEDWVS